jgi:hypothetical protein
MNLAVGKLSEHFNEEQKAKLRDARILLKGFYEGNDNAVTYPLTGLLNHLLGLGSEVWASSYVNEKVELLEGQVQ